MNCRILLIKFAALVATPALVEGQVGTPTTTKAVQNRYSAMPRFEARSNDPTSGSDTLAPVFESVSDPIVGALAFFNPTIGYNLRYGNGISVQPGRRVNSTVQELSPGASFIFAERITLSYSPTFTWYSEDELGDKVSHRASARAGGVLGRFEVGLSQGYNRTSSLLSETGVQTDQESWSTGLSLSTEVLQKSSLELSLNQNIRSTVLFNDVTSWSGMFWFRHRYSGSLDLSAGVGASYNSIDPGADTFSQQLKSGINWRPGERLSLSLTAGADRSEFRGRGRGAITNPVYGLSAQYRLFEPTSISLSASRSMGASYFANEITENEQYSLGVSQRLLGRFNLGLGASLREAHYVSRETSQVVVSRNDRRWSYSGALGTGLGERTSVSISWQRSEVESEVERFSYSSTSWGLSINWRY